jgi:hypothetical protein
MYYVTVLKHYLQTYGCVTGFSHMSTIMLKILLTYAQIMCKTVLTNYVENSTCIYAVMLKAVLACAKVCLKSIHICTVMSKTVLAYAPSLGFQGRIHRPDRMCPCPSAWNNLASTSGFS